MKPRHQRLACYRRIYFHEITANAPPNWIYPAVDPARACNEPNSFEHMFVPGARIRSELFASTASTISTPYAFSSFQALDRR